MLGWVNLIILLAYMCNRTTSNMAVPISLILHMFLGIPREIASDIKSYASVEMLHFREQFLHNSRP